MISLIAAIGKNRELGKDGELLYHLPEDMKFFKKTTMGHPILMGRKTFESIGRALPGRTNYVVSSHPETLPDGVEPVRELRQFLESWQESEEELFVIGGGMVYFEALRYADRLYLTEVEAEAPAADTFFPKFDKSKYERTELGKGEQDGVIYTFVRYDKK